MAFLAPSAAFYFVFVLLPIGQSGLYSFYDWSGVGPRADFIWFDNYIEAFQDPIFWRSLGNNFILVFASVGVQIPVGLALAMLLAAGLRGMRFFRAVFFLPVLMSTVAIGLLWIYIYNPNFGLLNAVLNAIGLSSLERGWLGEPGTALYAVIAVVSWQWTPFYMILFFAGLTTIPEELYEAARMDKADAWQRFWWVTLPSMRGLIVTASILALMGSLKYFDLIFVMTEGGPSYKTELLATNMYRQAFTLFRFGYASAVAVLLLLISLTLTTAVLYWSRRTNGQNS